MNALARIRPTRRQTIIGATLSGGALFVGACSRSDILGLGAPKIDFGAFGPFLKITADNVVTVINKHQEMGQGNHAGLAAMISEELDADWSKVKIQAAAADAKVGANTLMGVQGTGGSTAIANSWDQYRKAGATARAMFVQAAADTWKVPAGEVAVKDGVASHASGKSATLGELLPAAGKVTPPASVTLKPSTAYTLIGTDRVRRKDSLAKSTGTERYTQDVHLPNMLTAMVAHSPRFGGVVKSFDASKAKAVKGVVDVVQIPSGVAVIAENTWAAKQGREALVVTWDDSKAEMRSSDKMLADYKAVVTAPGTAWEPFEGRGVTGDKPAGIENAQAGADAKTPKPAEPIKTPVQAFETTYDFPYLAHATMEPMNCVAQVNGMKAKLTFASQIQTLDQLNTAMAVKTLPGSVEIETLSAGGSFGRRGNPTSDYVAECVNIAKHVGHDRPVKLVWTREDDMTGGRYRPMAHHALHVELDKDGYPSLWKHRIVIQSFMKGTPFMQGKIDDTQVEGVKGSPYLKATPLVDAAVFTPTSPVTTLWWRSVGATHASLAMEHTIDQLALRAGVDPLEYRRRLLTKAQATRHLAVLDLAAKTAGWDQPMEAGWARGIAVHESFGSVVANVAEVTLKDGQPHVRRVVVAIECGKVVAPDQVRAQMEGGVCYGLSSALYGAVTLKDGLVEQTNFDTYRVLRMDEAPQVETVFVASTAKPTGAGEPGTPVVIPAVANALLKLTGKPTTSMPFVKA
ncbi:xanthine dehydrogenase family protein molybdopterin-binding subunit [soil metagenome]